MSIQSEIDRINSNVQSALNAVADTGVSVPEGANSDNLPAAVSALANEKQDKLTGTKGQIVGFGADGLPVARDADFAPQSHAQDSTIHVTSQDKDAWNAKGKGNAIIYSGSYVGTGTYGSSNPTAITIPESSGMTNLKFIYVYQDNYWTMLSKNQLYAASYYRSGDNVSLIAYQVKSSMSGRTVTFFHSAQANRQLNEAGKTYNFFAFGE